MAQVARNLPDCDGGILGDHRFLILERDSKFTDQFKRVPRDARTEVVLCPQRSPNCNVSAERFVLTIKSECLSKMIFCGETALRRACSEFPAHYPVERAHQGLTDERIECTGITGTGEVECSERLGGLLWHYRRIA